jgi:hypothetical protein
MSQQFFRPVTALSLAILFAVQLEPHGPKAAIAEGSAPGSDISELWEAPVDLAREDLLNGSWDTTHSPDPHAIFTFARLKRRGVNPGVVVTDPLGRRWHVKQRGRNDAGAEGPVEVFLSRVLSAVGYHQPPMYFLPSFTHDKRPGGRREVSPRGPVSLY